MTQTPPHGTPRVHLDNLVNSAHQHAWPNVLGTVAIVFGSLGTLGGSCGVIGQFVGGPLLLRMWGSVPGNAPMETTEGFKWILVEVFALKSVLAVLLIATGIAMTRRRPAARSMALVWSCAKMVVVVASLAIGYIVQLGQLEAMGQQQAAMPPIMRQMQQMMAVVVFLFAVLWGWALPIFMIFWLNRRKVRDEIAGWS